MKGYVTDSAGACYELPPCESWEMEYGVGTPCDSFVRRCPWSMGQGISPRQWSRFYALWQGERVFTGVVDEYEIALGPSGLTGTVTGRGMAALLLDNEAGTAEYDRAQLEQIVAEYVSPFGIALGEHIALPALTSFGVDSGDSGTTFWFQLKAAEPED